MTSLTWPQESLRYVMRAQTLVDRVAAGTTSAADTDRAREQKLHMRIPVLRAVLESMRAEAEADTQHSHRPDPTGPTPKAALDLPFGTVLQADRLPCGD
jgi:sulfite reductase beta subunit-like hemoprotein